MRRHSLKVFSLSCFLGLMAGSVSLPVAFAKKAVLTSELISQRSQDGAMKTCTAQRIDLGSPKLSNTDLKLLTFCKAQSIPQLLVALKSQDWKVRVVSAYTLGLFGKEAQNDIPALIDLLNDENADVRFAAAGALGEIGNEAVVPALTNALQDKDENVRVSAADAFLKIGAVAKSAKPVLIDALWDGNYYVRKRVAGAINKIGLEESDIPRLIKQFDPFLKGGGDTNGSIVSVMVAIDPKSKEKVQDIPLFFMKALENPDPSVRESSAIALRDIVATRLINDSRLEEIKAALRKANTDSYSQASGLSIPRRQNQSSEELRKLLKDKDLAIRVNALVELSKDKGIDLQDYIYTSILTEGLLSNNSEIRLNSIRGVSRICNRINRQYLEPQDNTKKTKGCLDKSFLKLITNILKDNDRRFSYAAAFTIPTLDPSNEAAIPILKSILQEEYDLNARRLAINSLSAIGSQNALSVLTESNEIGDRKMRYALLNLHHSDIDDETLRLSTEIYSSYFKDFSIFERAFKNANTRFLASRIISFRFAKGIRQKNAISPFENERVIAKMNSIISDEGSTYDGYSVLKQILKLKNQDLRRSAVYILGKIGTKANGGVQEKNRMRIVEILKSIVKDSNNNIDIRWIAAVSLQKMNVPTDEFFSSNKLIDPRQAQLQFDNNSRVSQYNNGILFDNYSADILKDYVQTNQMNGDSIWTFTGWSFW